MADDILIDPSTLPLKEQHRMRAELVRDGARSMGRAKILDYTSATPTFKKPKAKRKSRAKVKTVVAKLPDEQEAMLKFFDPEVVAALNAGQVNDFSIAEPVIPEKPETASDIILRLNAGLRV